MAVDVRPPRRYNLPSVSRGVAAGVVVALALGVLCGWLGLRVYRDHQADQDRALFLEVGKQGAVNLTTVDYQRVEADVQRILDSATGVFRDEFSSRSAPFIDVVRKVQSKSVGTVTAAGVESMTPEQGTVLVALSVTSTNAAEPEQQPPRYWRMRLTVNKIDDGAKVSRVDFVP